MSYVLYNVFAIKAGLLSIEQFSYLTGDLKATVKHIVNEDTGTPQAVYTFRCKAQAFNDQQLKDICALMDANSDSCGGLSHSDELAIERQLIKYGDPQAWGIQVTIGSKW